MADIKQIIDGIGVPVIAVDSKLKIVTSNNAAQKRFGDVAVGTGVEAAGFYKNSLKKLLGEALATGAEATTKITLKDDFADTFLVTIKALGLTGPADARILILTLEDRTSLQSVKAMRSDFVANVSHEIRSPLTAISGFVETLQDRALGDPDAQALFLNLMEKEVTRMTNLVSDLLSLSQVEAKERRVIKKTVDPNLILRQAQEAAGTLATQRNKILQVESDGDLPGIPGNHDDLARVLINLLENAVNYSRDQGHILMRAGVTDRDNPLGKKAICIAVHDESDGIPTAEIPRLTERFYRVDKSRSRNVGGTGLGLAIVKHILVRHRGKLVIESTLGKGSVFKVYLPMEKP